MTAAIIILGVLFVGVWRLSAPFSNGARMLVWGLAILWTVGMLLAHNWAMSQDDDGLVLDTSVDAVKYFDTAAAVQDYAISEEISATSGSVLHLGYYYLNVAAMKVSDQPMLVLRLFKLTLFMGALLCLVRLWRSCYGEGLAILGMLYMTLGHWEFFYNTFRNFKDGVIASLVMFILVLVETPAASLSLDSPPRHSRPTVRWLLILLTVAGLFTLRSYLAVAMVASISLGAFIESERISLGKTICIAGLAIIGGVLFVRNGMMDYAQEAVHILFSDGLLGFGTRVVKVMVSPIPWQHFQPILIPSHCLYLVFFPFVVHACIVLFRRKFLWQLSFVLLLFGALSLLESSEYRKRLPLMPFFVTWVLAASAERRGIVCRAGEKRKYHLEPSSTFL